MRRGERALATAEKLSRGLDVKASKVDAAAVQYASALADYAQAFTARQQQLIAAGLIEWGRGGQPAGIGAGLRYALREHDALGLVDVRDDGVDAPLAAQKGGQ